MDSTTRDRFIRALAGRTYPGASGDSLVIFDGKDLHAKPQLSMYIHGGQAAKVSGQSAILSLPPSFPSLAGLQTLATQLEQAKPRVYPIKVVGVVGPIVGVSELDLELPAGWQADLPQNVAAASEFGSYTAEYSQSGRELRVYRRLAGRRGVKPPEDVDALIAWLRAVAKDDAQYIMLQRGTVMGK